MPQPSYEYAIGRISVLSTKMLNAAQLRRISEAPTAKAAMALLVETGYGENLTEEQINSDEIDNVIREQLQLTRKRIWELTPDPELTGLFLLMVDTHNIKALLKARFLGIDASDILRSGGNFELEFLKACINTKTYDDLPDDYKETLEKIENDSTHGIDPLRFSAFLDGAMFRHIKKVLDARNDHSFVRDYFSLLADSQNAQSVVRARLMNWDIDKLKLLLIECGEIPFKVFTDNIETPIDQLSQKFNIGKNGGIISSSLAEYAQTNDTTVMKDRKDAELMAILRKVRWDHGTLGPIVGYLMARETEARALRLIFGSKQGNVEIDFDLPAMFA